MSNDTATNHPHDTDADEEFDAFGERRETAARTMAVQHPAMSHALLIEDRAGRNDHMLGVWAAAYVARNFDAMLDPDEFVCVEVLPDTPDTFSVFS